MTEPQRFLFAFKRHDALNSVTASPRPAIDRNDDRARQSVIALRVRQLLPDIPTEGLSDQQEGK
jgi:hypothetical protein